MNKKDVLDMVLSDKALEEKMLSLFTDEYTAFLKINETDIEQYSFEDTLWNCLEYVQHKNVVYLTRYNFTDKDEIELLYIIIKILALSENKTAYKYAIKNKILADAEHFSLSYREKILFVMVFLIKYDDNMYTELMCIYNDAFNGNSKLKMKIENDFIIYDNYDDWGMNQIKGGVGEDELEGIFNYKIENNIIEIMNDKKIKEYLI